MTALTDAIFDLLDYFEGNRESVWRELEDQGYDMALVADVIEEYGI